MSRTARPNLHKITDPAEVIITKNLSQEKRRVMAASATGDILSIDSADTAKLVSKGGPIPDQFRRSQQRRDNYLSSLITNSVNEKTNILQKMVSSHPASPVMKVQINDQYTIDGIMPFAHSTEVQIVSRGTTNESNNHNLRPNSLGWVSNEGPEVN